MHALLLVPTNLIHSTSKFFADDYVIKYAHNLGEFLETDTRPIRNVLYVLGFEDVSNICSLVSDTLEAVLIACPTKSPELYFQLIRSSKINRSAPLQVHMFHAPLYENPEEIEKIFF
jgi:hypothetical protein